MLTFVFLYVTLGVLLQGRFWLRACLLVVVYGASHGRLFIRPHLFEFFFVSLFIMLLALYEKREKPLYLFLILPFEALWVNIHSSAILGLFLIGTYAAGRLLDEVRLSGFKNFDLDRKVIIPGLAALIAPVAALINPYGPKLVIFPFIHHGVDNKDAIRHIAEWMRPEFRELFFYFYPWPIEHFGFVALFFAALACLVLNARNTRSWAYMLFAGSLYMAVSHVRWVPLFSVFAAPVLAMGLKGVLERLEERSWPKAAVVVFAVFLTVILASKHLSPSGAFVPNMGLGLKEGRFPEGTVAYMKKEGLRGNLYNEYVFGGYLIYELPEVKVFIDGRTPTVYSSYFFWTSRLAEDHRHARHLAEGLAALPGIRLDPTRVQTNIVIFYLDQALDAQAFLLACRGEDVLLGDMGHGALRAVTHADVSADDCDKALERIARVITSQRASGFRAVPAARRD